MRIQKIFLILAGILALLLPAAATAQKVTRSSLPTCGRFPDNVEDYSCTCPANPRLGSVWGSGPYTADSDICTAALHAGGISQAGGEVWVKAAPGQSSYQGSSANGVTTSNWGSYGRSFTVVAPGKPAQAGLPACDRLPGGTDALECSCSGAAAEASGSLWGSGPYTADSAICAAAVHAGVLAPGQAGNVSVLRVPGLDSYRGSTANGVQSSSWRAFDSSIVFNRN